MRILILHSQYKEFGGEDEYVRKLKQILRQNGNTVISYIPHNKNISSLFDKWWAALGLLWNFKSARDVAEILKRERPDIVQIQNLFPHINPSVYHTIRRFNIPMVQRVSSYRFVCPRGWLFRKNEICKRCIRKTVALPAIFFGCYHKSIIASIPFVFGLFLHRYIFRSFKLVDRFIFPSAFTQSILLGSGIVERHKTIVVPTSGTVDSVKMSYTKVSSRYEKKYVYVGRISEEKGIFDLLENLKSHPHISLLILGSASKEVKNKYSKYKNLVFLGFKENRLVLNYLSSATALILPSLWYDVLPNALIESFSVGTPVIAPRIGVFPKLISNKKTGVLYRYRDYDDLVNILSSFKKTRAMQRCISLEYQKKYAPVKHYNSLMRIYKQLMIHKKIC